MNELYSKEYFDAPYKHAKEFAHQFYRKMGSVSCAYFDDETIYFNSDGFTHLIRKGKNPRPKSEQRRRFYLLQYVKDILRKPLSEVSYVVLKKEQIIERYGEKIKETIDAEFWTFTYHPKPEHTLKVVIRRLKKTSTKHFFSVMGNKAFFREILAHKKSPR